MQWNIGGARNLAMHVASGAWVYLSDMDHLLGDAARDVAELFRLAQKEEDDVYYKFMRRREDGTISLHPGSYLIRNVQ